MAAMTAKHTLMCTPSVVVAYRSGPYLHACSEHVHTCHQHSEPTRAMKAAGHVRHPCRPAANQTMAAGQPSPAWQWCIWSSTYVACCTCLMLFHAYLSRCSSIGPSLALISFAKSSSTWGIPPTYLRPDREAQSARTKGKAKCDMQGSRRWGTRREATP